MATVKSTLTLTATNLTTDSLSTSVLTTLTGMKTGGIHIERIVGADSGTAQEIAEEDAFAGVAYTYLRNVDDTGTISVEIGGVFNMVLAPGEWAWFPWRADDSDDLDVFQDQGATGTLLEFGFFGA